MFLLSKVWGGEGCGGTPCPLGPSGFSSSNIGGHRRLFYRMTMLPFGSHQPPLYKVSLSRSTTSLIRHLVLGGGGWGGGGGHGFRVCGSGYGGLSFGLKVREFGFWRLLLKVPRGISKILVSALRERVGEREREREGGRAREGEREGGRESERALNHHASALASALSTINPAGVPRS